MTVCSHRATLSAMPGNMKGPKNPNWKGGRSVASNGYVIVRVGRGHHLSDVRGYAYEHRMVAEEMLGRKLKPGEVVHHKDHDKENNSVSNLVVYPSGAHHAVAHRTPGKVLRLPGEANAIVECECGCGATFKRFDRYGRPRRFTHGSHSQRVRQ